MGEMDIGSAVASDLTNAVTDYSVDTVDTDAATGQKETYYVNTNWSQQLGFYKKNPRYASSY